MESHSVSVRKTVNNQEVQNKEGEKSGGGRLGGGGDLEVIC